MATLRMRVNGGYRTLPADPERDWQTDQSRKALVIGNLEGSHYQKRRALHDTLETLWDDTESNPQNDRLEYLADVILTTHALLAQNRSNKL